MDHKKASNSYIYILYYILVEDMITFGMIIYIPSDLLRYPVFFAIFKSAALHIYVALLTWP